MADKEFDATPSWSGYIYQGKIAIFHALTIINKELKENRDFDFDQYKLEIEWMEDFAILNGGGYESIHQVKAYKDSTPGAYKDAIEDLFKKLNDKPNLKGYLHVWNEIRHYIEAVTCPREQAPAQTS